MRETQVANRRMDAESGATADQHDCRQNQQRTAVADGGLEKPEFVIGRNASALGTGVAVRQGFEPWVQLLGRTTV
jgi:hypothetical protein